MKVFDKKKNTRLSKRFSQSYLYIAICISDLKKTNRGQLISFRLQASTTKQMVWATTAMRNNNKIPGIAIKFSFARFR